MQRILILTSPGDAHAYAVAEALRRKGAAVTLWHTTDFPTRSLETIEFDSTTRRVTISTLESPELGCHSVWHRRPAFSLDTNSLHPADHGFAERQCQLFRDALFKIMHPGAFWVNPRAAAVASNNKILQHVKAQKVGFLTPHTLYTNDPVLIKEFIRTKKGRVVFKPLMGMQWHTDDGISWVPFTSTVSSDDINEERAALAVPGIFQEEVSKRYELRVTMIGKHAYAARLWSQETSSGRRDWRKAYDELTIDSVVLDEHVEKMCYALLQELGLVFGCLDLIVTPSDEVVFLEVNQMGQFLFIEDYTNLPLLDAFSEFLLSGTADWCPGNSDIVRYSDVQDAVKESLDLFSAAHVPARPNSTLEASQ